MKALFSRLMREEDGQGMAEYGLILALIAVVVIGALAALGTGVMDIFDNVTAGLSGTIN